MKIAQNISDLVGNTPIVALHNIEKEFSLKAQLVAKLEYLNPAGSAKDRIAKAMIEEAFADGRLNRNSVIIEPTSGNTGIGLAAVAASYGLKVILTMPETMSVERRNLLKAYGAELVLTEGSLGMAGAVKKAEEIAAATKDSFIAGQFDNPVNPKAHEQTTGPEIWRDTDGKVAAFVAGIGTGGTLSGTGRFLKAQNKNIRIIGVEPASSPLLTQNRAGAHKIQGIGANFVPANLDRTVYDEVMPVTDEDAIETAKMLAKKEGFLTGISSGAALFAAMQLAKKEEFKDRIIVALLPDTGDRYLSVLN
ncbi:MAG: cysteine synthase A [Treponemataceae bacterium]|nr:cysteine synthase A [Treponemataceae bacterium]